MSITITPLSASPLPPTYHLTVDGASILLDCGAYDKGSETTLSHDAADAAGAPTAEQVDAYLSTLRALAPSLNLVLLSHPLSTSLGLLPYLRAKCGLRCPVYATLPTREMGRYAVEEWVEARSVAERNDARVEQKLANQHKEQQIKDAAAEKKRRKGKAKVQDVEVGVGEDLVAVKEEELAGAALVKDEEGDTVKAKDPWDQAWKLTTQEIRDAFLAINAVRWTQPIHLTGALRCAFPSLAVLTRVFAGPLKGYTLVAHRSGHTLGGSLYTLRPSLSSSLSPASSASSFLYAPLFNHVKEHHLDPTSLLNAGNVDDNFRRMGVVVVGAERSKVVNIKRIDRERKLLGASRVAHLTLDSSTTDQSSTTSRPHHHDAPVRRLDSPADRPLGASVRAPRPPRDALAFRRPRFAVPTVPHLAHGQGRRRVCALPDRVDGRATVGRRGRKAQVQVRRVLISRSTRSTDDGCVATVCSNLRIFSSLDEIAASIPPTVPKLILTVPSTLSYGFARALFLDFARTPSNLVLLTGLSEPGSLARWLAQEVWEPQQDEGCKYGQGKVGKEIKMDQTIELEVRQP